MRRLFGTIAAALILNLLFAPLAFADETINFAATNDDAGDIGAATGRVKEARAFTPTANATAINPTLCLSKTGSPTDNIIIGVEADSSGVPSNTDLASISIAGSSLSSTCSTPTAKGTISVSLTAGTKYWIVLHRSGSLDDSNKYEVNTHSGGSTSFDATYVSSWATWTNDFQGSVFVTEPTAGTPRGNTVTFFGFW